MLSLSVPWEVRDQSGITWNKILKPKLMNVWGIEWKAFKCLLTVCVNSRNENVTNTTHKGKVKHGLAFSNWFQITSSIFRVANRQHVYLFCRGGNQTQMIVLSVRFQITGYLSLKHLTGMYAFEIISASGIR